MLTTGLDPRLTERAKALLGEKTLIFSLHMTSNNMDAYREYAEFAASCGATHLSLGGLPFKYRWELPDNTDPYPNWSVFGISLFRVFTPPAMHEWIPQEQAQEWQELFAARAEILRQCGLKASVEGGEPQWLPEGIYRAHPRWRGGQVELGRIAGKPYFSPSIDEPEVLEMYRWSMEQLCKHIPELECFSFWTNDCGSGLPWSVHTYPGMNGPMKYRGRNPGDRVVGWMKALQQGASDANVPNVKVNLQTFSFSPADSGAIRPLLGEDLYLNGVNGKGEGMTSSGASLSTGMFTQLYPAVGMGDPAAFVRGLQGVYQPGNTRAGIAVDLEHLPLAKLIMETYLEEPGQGLVHEKQTLLKVAGKFAGETHAETMVRVWEGLVTAYQGVAQIRQRGASVPLPFLHTSTRWLTRPLVPKPLELTAEEKAHYEKFLFSVGTEEQSANLCYFLGKPVFNGDGVVWMTRWCLHECIGRLNGLRGMLAPMLQQEGVRLFDARLGVAVCLLETAKWTLMYQHALSIADQPRWGSNLMDFDDNIQWDQRTLELRKIARGELDNITELIDLLESAPGPVIAMTDKPELESVFWFGPSLVDDLKRKMDIMLNHWHEYEQMYPTHKVWEFEPEIPEQLSTDC
ncbi:MAG: hypothetical protein ACYDBB_09510 [Armatimonadota bacterium]